MFIDQGGGDTYTYTDMFSSTYLPWEPEAGLIHHSLKLI